jgi:hypothetical protein
MNIAFVGPAYTERSSNLNAQTCVNLFPVSGGPDGKTPTALYRTPGLTAFTTVGTTAVRGMHVFAGTLFAVSGATLYAVDAAGTAAPKGTLNTAAGRVAFADNGQVMALVDGSDGWIWDGNVLARITDPDFPAATRIAFNGGYFVFDAPATAGRFMVSGLYATDPADFVSALDYATAEADPDSLAAIRSVEGHLWLLGENTAEVWYPSGEAFPFNPVGGARLDRGCAAPWSAAQAGDALLWLARDRQGRVQVVMSQGFQVGAVSTPALEHAIAGYATISDATAYAYHQEGHTFYVLSFPTADATWAYDLTTGLWHRRGGWDGQNGRYTRHRGDAYAYFGRRHLVGDWQTGKVYALDPGAYTDDGATLRCERTAPAVWADHKRVFFHALTLDVEAGVGDARTPAPVVLLDWSDDGGHTWSADRTGALDGGLGATGEYARRLAWRRLGAARQRYFRVAVSDPVKVAILGAGLDATVGAA